MNTGSPPTARKARTGLFTPPGILFAARSKSSLDLGSLTEVHGTRFHLPGPGRRGCLGARRTTRSYSPIELSSARVIGRVRGLARVTRSVGTTSGAAKEKESSRLTSVIENQPPFVNGAGAASATCPHSLPAMTMGAPLLSSVYVG